MNDHNIYQDLRNRLFTTTPDSIGIKNIINEQDAPYGAIMEIGYPDGTATLVCFITGDASIYFSGGGGMIGGIGHENIRSSSIKFVEQSKIFLGEMDKTTTFPFAENGNVIFYILTINGVYTAKDKEDNLGNEKSNFSPLFFLGHKVITGLREMEENSESSRNFVQNEF